MVRIYKQDERSQECKSYLGNETGTEKRKKAEQRKRGKRLSPKLLEFIIIIHSL